MPPESVAQRNEREFLDQFDELSRNFHTLLPHLQPHFIIALGFIRLMVLVSIRIYALLAIRLP